MEVPARLVLLAQLIVHVPVREVDERVVLRLVEPEREMAHLVRGDVREM